MRLRHRLPEEVRASVGVLVLAAGLRPLLRRGAGVARLLEVWLLELWLLRRCVALGKVLRLLELVESVQLLSIFILHLASCLRVLRLFLLWILIFRRVPATGLAAILGAKLVIGGLPLARPFALGLVLRRGVAVELLLRLLHRRVRPLLRHAEPILKPVHQIY